MPGRLKVSPVVCLGVLEQAQWIENGGMKAAMEKQQGEGDLFAGTEVEGSGAAEGGTE
jgi:hypothetical protein